MGARVIMIPPHPPISCGTQKTHKQVLTTKLQRELLKIDTTFPQEGITNSMAITNLPLTILWRPNNYRRQIKVKTSTNSTIKNIKSAIGAIPSKHNRLIFIKTYPGVTLQLGKNSLTAIHSQNIIGGVKEVYLLKGTITNINKKLDKKAKEIKNKLDAALKIFSYRFKINLPSERPQWQRFEDWIKGEEFIDSIPKEVIIHDTVFKKVYGEGIEFKGKTPVVNIKTYIKNRAIEEIAPKIALELKKIQEGNNPLKTLIPQIAKPQDLLRPDLRNLYNKLNPLEKNYIDELTFNLEA